MSGSFFPSHITGFKWRYCIYLDFTTLLINTYLVSTLSLISFFVDLIWYSLVPASTAQREGVTIAAPNRQLPGDKLPQLASSSSPPSSSTLSYSHISLCPTLLISQPLLKLYLVCHSSPSSPWLCQSNAPVVSCVSHIMPTSNPKLIRPSGPFQISQGTKIPTRK